LFCRFDGCGGDQITSRVFQQVLKKEIVPDADRVYDSRVRTGVREKKEGFASWLGATGN